VLGQAHTPRRRLLPAVALTLVILVVPAVGLAGRATLHPHHAKLRALASRHRAAVLGLYSLDRQLVLAHGRLTSLERRQTALRAQRTALANGLVVAHRSLRIARSRVARQLRYLYEAGTVSPIEVVFGARTFDDAMTNIDDLNATTSASRALVTELRAARVELVHEQRALALRAAALAAARAHAAATEAALTRTRAVREAYIASLAREQRVATERIARKAVIRTSHLRASRSIATSIVPAGTQLTVSTTAYSLGGYTSSGLLTGWGVVAVDPSVIPLGTHMTIPGYGEAVAADTGTAIIGNRLDLWFPTLAMAQAWGRRTITITLH
jgi:3D (Asp-Asp-Asp) domain-containing protein